MASMDDMMNMSFDALNNEVGTTISSGSAIGGGSRMLSHAGGSSSRSASSQGRGRALQMAEVPDHAQELQVYFHGRGADGAARSCGPGCTLEPARAALACAGKRDFILFEPLDDAARDGTPIVVVTLLGAARGELKGAQVYLASSLAQWLSEHKTDGAGRAYGECKDEDPTLRKHFTRAQILAIRKLGGAA